MVGNFPTAFLILPIFDFLAVVVVAVTHIAQTGHLAAPAVVAAAPMAAVALLGLAALAVVAAVARAQEVMPGLADLAVVAAALIAAPVRVVSAAAVAVIHPKGCTAHSAKAA